MLRIRPSQDFPHPVWDDMEALCHVSTELHKMLTAGREAPLSLFQEPWIFRQPIQTALVHYSLFLSLREYFGDFE